MTNDNLTANSAQCPYSPLDPDVLADPFPAYAQLRSECPVHNTNMGGREFLTVANRADVHNILTSPNEWVNRYGAGIAYSGVDGRGNLQHFDQPEHTKRRVLMRNEFNPIEVKKLADDAVRARLLAGEVIGLRDAGDGRERGAYLRDAALRGARGETRHDAGAQVAGGETDDVQDRAAHGC